MKSRIYVVLSLLAVLFFTGCSSVPLASKAEDMAKKEFRSPTATKAGVYVYRSSAFFGKALSKEVFINGKSIGELSSGTYFYKEIEPGNYKLSTESEFGENDVSLIAKPGVNYFISQYIKFGLIVGGAGIEQVSREIGQKAVLECELAK